ncbi:unc-119 B [Pelobates cultripes]|uniref:Unc-119 B n=1 Tax=Pelobates cultripes TaxID=61616 RepID=A0AAD1VW26_PELCU|nr:unc-119 B [Pelobates cultripes]
MYEHSVLKIILILLALAVYIVTVAFNAIAGSGLLKGIFLQNVGNISNKYDTDFTPAGWTFMIWNVIFAWQFLWLGYVLSLICRRTDVGWFYLKPNVFPVSFYLVWMLNNVLNIGWLFLWDREHTIPALVFLGAIALTNYIVLFISYRAVFIHGDWLQRLRKSDLWLIRIFVHNGIAVYTTWTTIACLLNFAVVLTYNGGYSNSTSTTIALAILTFEVLLWFCLENFVFDKYVRYTITVYPVVIVALSGAMNKSYNPASPGPNGIFIAVLLAVACTLFAARLVLVVVKHCKRPLYGSVLFQKTSLPMS